MAVQPLYDSIISEGRQIYWYEKGDVPDTLDGRFDMIAAIFCIVMFRLENTEEAKKQIVWLTELFVNDMDGQLRQIGIGDMIVGKHVGRMMGALGGRLGAYRDALAGEGDIKDALIRNLYRGDAPESAALEFTYQKLQDFHSELQKMPIDGVLQGQISVSSA